VGFTPTENRRLSRRTEKSGLALARAIHDPRREVRSAVCDAIVKFRLSDLVGELVVAYGNQRSRKGKRDIENALRHFNDLPEVVAFGRTHELGPSFFEPPPYVHDWEKNREGWL
jgi:hypothetical protein